MIFPYKLYIADKKNEMHKDKKLNSIPSQIVLMEESFISPIPNELIPKILKLIELIKYITIKTINIEKELFISKSVITISSLDNPIHSKYIRPEIVNNINFFSLISIVFISSIDIEDKMHRSIKVKNIIIDIIC